MKRINKNCKDFKVKRKCNICGHEFSVRKSEMKKTKIWVHIKAEIETHLFGRDYERKVYRREVDYISVCPNCGNKNDEFFYDGKRKKFGGWKVIYYD